MVTSMDADGSGKIEYDEFLAAAMDKKALVTEQGLASLFGACVTTGLWGACDARGWGGM